MMIVRAPLILLGFHPAMVLFCGGLNLIYQFWIHTEAIGRMPRWFEAVMNTPSHHRVHHGRNPRYLDANYAGVFIIWDKMFGTFRAEQDDERGWITGWCTISARSTRCAWRSTNGWRFSGMRRSRGCQSARLSSSGTPHSVS
jgi:hypothetical protein